MDLLPTTPMTAAAVADGEPSREQGLVVEILVAAGPEAPMLPRPSVRAVPGKGLEGDRYFEGKGTFSPDPMKADFELTLIQQEHVIAYATEYECEFTARDARRNIVTQGIDLNALVGKDFRIGPVMARGLRLCEPCNYLAKQTRPDVLRGLLHKGGLRAQILSGGEIRLGDTVSNL